MTYTPTNTAFVKSSCSKSNPWRRERGVFYDELHVIHFSKSPKFEILKSLKIWKQILDVDNDMIYKRVEFQFEIHCILVWEK